MAKFKGIPRDMELKFYLPLTFVLTAGEAAVYANVSIWTIYAWIDAGKICARAAEYGRGWLISKPSIDSYLRSSANHPKIG